MGQPGTGVHPAAPGPQYFRASELWWEGTVIRSSRPREVKSKIQQLGKKRKKDIKNTTASHRESQDGRALLSGWWTRLLEDVCWSRCIGVWGRSKTEHRGVSAIHDARSVRDLARHQTRRCLQVNWKKKGTGGDCAMLCVPGNKEIRSTQRRLREAKPMWICRRTTDREKLKLQRDLMNKQLVPHKIPKHRCTEMGWGRTKTGSESDARALIADSWK